MSSLFYPWLNRGLMNPPMGTCSNISESARADPRMTWKFMTCDTGSVPLSTSSASLVLIHTRRRWLVGWTSVLLWACFHPCYPWARFDALLPRQHLEQLFDELDVRELARQLVTLLSLVRNTSGIIVIRFFLHFMLPGPPPPAAAHVSPL